MVSEIALIQIDPAESAAFEEAVAQAEQNFHAADGCYSFRLDRAVDRPGLYILTVGWESVEAHMVAFRNSEGFQRWRALAGPFFQNQPDVFHCRS
ncbi:MAG: antibiotic biosynthesis monooxygenase [Sphingobium sp.]|nr:antibiotic biosynthesis monooxygenase [Sphingobium sp.]